MPLPNPPRTLFGRLIEPRADVHGPEERSRARFLAALLLLLPLVAAVGVSVQVFVDPTLLRASLIQIPAVGFGLVLQRVARTPKWRVALGLTMVIVVISTLGGYFARPESEMVLANLIVPAILATALLTTREAVIVALAMYGCAVVVGLHFLPEFGVGWFAGVLVTMSVLLFLEVLATMHRVRLERDRQRDLADREAVSRRLLEASFGGLAVVSGGVIQEVNRGFATLFGEEPDALIGRPLDAFLPHDAPVGSLDGEGRKEVAARRSDGSFVPVAVVTRADSNPDGSSHVVGVQDLTEREAVRARLHQADRMAAMGQLAAGVAHEINNPLTWIIGNLERVVGEVDDEHRKSVEQAIEGARRVRRIARDLNMFARDRDGPTVGVDVVEVVRSAVNMVRHDLQHNGFLHEDYGEAPSVDGDPTRLGQVCMNLLVNAAQAVADGAGTEVSVRVGTDARGWATFTVEDDGPGIPEALRARVFEPFFSTKADGTGLGLAISRTLVDELRGTLTLEPIAERGVRVHVALPPGTLPLPPREDTGEATRPSSRRARILVVDDEPAICELLQAALGEHHVETATSGELGLERALAETWDVVLCDLMMPAVTGMDLFETLRAQHPGREARVIFLTGGAFTPRARAFLDEIDNPVLQKPFRLAKVRDTVAALIDA